MVGNYNNSQLGNNQGDVGQVYRSTDHGAHWAATSGASGVAKSFVTVGSTLFVATTQGIFRSTDDGVTWSAISGTSQLSPIKLHYANGVLYVGSSTSGVYRSSDNGNTFVASSQGLPGFASVAAIANIGNTIVIGVGSLFPNPDGVFRSTDGGLTWEEANNGIGGIAVIDFQVIGNTIFVTSGGALYKSVDLAANWTPVNIGTSDYPLEMQVTSDAFYVSVYTPNGFKVQRSVDNGATWSLAGFFPLAGEDIKQLAAIGTELFAGLGKYGSVYRSMDAAASWQPARAGLVGLDINAIFPSGSRLYSGSVSDDGVHVSTDGGATWLPSSAGLPDPFRTVSAFTQNAGYLFAAVKYWGTYRSSDNGATWSAANAGLTTGARQINALTVDGETLFAATEDGVWKSTTNGNAWTIASPAGGPGHPRTISIAALNGSIFAGTETYGLFQSTDGGANWTGVTNGLAGAGAIYSLTVRGSDLIAGTGAGVYLSADNGASWSPRNNGLPAGAARTVAAQGATLVTAIYDSANLLSRGVFISNNSGTSWSSYGGGIDPLAVRTLVFAPNALLAGTEAHSILSVPLAAPLSFLGAVSRKTHGTAGTYDVNLPLTGTAGVECRSGAAGHTLVFTFSNDVASGSASVQGAASIAGNPIFSGQTMTVNLTGVANAQLLTITLSNITDAFGQVLPATNVPVRILFGDTNGNGAVNATDVAQTKANIGAAMSGNSFRSDVTINGGINSSDVGAVKSAASGAAAAFTQEKQR